MIDNTAGAGTPSNDAGEPNSTDSTTAPNAGTAPPSGTENQNAGDAGVQNEETTKASEPVVPESYDLKMPEGVELDTAAADEFTAVAKELKLDQGAAQKLADIAGKMAQKQIEAHAKAVETWTEQVKTDKEIGGDKLEQSLGVARQAIDAFGSTELKALLNSTGLGNHPEVVKFAHRVGKAISEDRLVTGSPKGAETDLAKKLFPNMN